MTDIIVRINDRGEADYVQLECKTDNNTANYLLSSLMMAKNDTVTTFSKTPISVDVRNNDIIPSNCIPVSEIEVIKNPSNGDASLNANHDRIVYTSNAGFYGMDTVSYRLICNGDTTVANVYIMVVNPLSQKYVACEGANVAVGVMKMTGVAFWWYDAQTGTNLVKSTAFDTIQIIKDNTATQSYWVEPRYKGITFPRVSLTVEKGSNCGTINPTGCAATGTVIYKEDFGGNTTRDPDVKKTGIPQVKNYTYSDSLYGYGTYTIAKTSKHFYHSSWHKNIDDHTYPNDINHGYMAGFDASQDAGQFYECQIDGLCSGIDLYFSVWISNILKTSGRPHKPRQIFIVEDLAGNVLAQYYTNVPNDGDATWKQYGFNFILPDNILSIKLKIVNNGTGSDGNDFAFDDIEIRACVPPVTLTQPQQIDTTISVGASITFEGNYDDNKTFGDNLVYRWEYNAGDINDPSDWDVITDTKSSSDGKVNSVYTINSATLSDAGYYRLVVADAAHIDDYNCRAMSDIIHLHVICSTTGTVIYREDFGGNNISDPAVKPTGIQQVKNYKYSTTLYGYGTYTIAKTTTPFYFDKWHKQLDDHTSPGDTLRGYMIGFDASEDTGQFYECRIDGLCDGVELYFSLWILNLHTLTDRPDNPRQIFIVENLSGAELARYYSSVPNDGDSTWRQRGFNFTVPAGVTSIILKIINNGTGSYGNDFALDDIEIRACFPPVTLTKTPQPDTAVCAGSSITFEGNYTDDGTFGNNLVYRWEKNTGDINKPSDWIVIDNTQDVSNDGMVNSELLLNPVELSDEGYYRLAVANSISINNYNCRAMSEIIRLRVMPSLVFAGTVSADQTICYNTQPNPLTSEAATGGAIAITYQWQESIDGGNSWENIIGETALTYTPPALTKTTKYRLLAQSGTAPCETNTSDIVTITVLQQLTAGTIAAHQAILSGQRPASLTSTSASGGTGTYNYQWQKRIEGTSWTDIQDSTQETLSPDTITEITYYRRKVTSGNCDPAYTDSVIVIPLKPLSQKYIACEGVSVTVELTPINNVKFYWFLTETTPLPLQSDNSYTMTKTSALADTLWVEPRYGSKYFPVRYPVVIELGDCGVINPTNCASTGTVLFKEDYGGNGNNETYPERSSTALGSGIVDYTFCDAASASGCIEGEGFYAITKKSITHTVNSAYWHGGYSDHTYPNDITKGYMFLANAGWTPSKFYEYRIDNLCANVDLYFSAWLSNLCKPGVLPKEPHLKIELSDTAGNVLASYYTGILPRNDANTGLVWLQYGFTFNNVNHSSVIMRIYNNGEGGTGNDFVMDDIEIRLCAPPVLLPQLTNLDTLLCVGSTFTATATYTDDETYGDNLSYRWEKNTEDINNPDDWKVIFNTADESTDGTVSSELSINAATLSDVGYYRLAVANYDNIDNYNCRSMSDIIRVRVVTPVISGIASADQTICHNTAPAELTSTAATGGSIAMTYQWQESTNGGSSWENITSGTNGTSLNYTPPALIQSTKYRLIAKSGTAICETDTGNTVTITVKHICAHNDTVTNVSCDDMPIHINVLSNDTTQCTPIKIDILKGSYTVNNSNEIVYDGTLSGWDTLVYRISCNNETSTASVYIYVNPSASAFVDNVWYYGENSQGIRFVNNNGVYSATDASGESKVNSHENSLVVSSPYCDGQVIFYSSHNQLFNSLHEPMENGHFMGHQSVADGLAACYMGNNKYLLFSVTDSYEDGNRGLKAYTIDMNEDHGKGKIVDSLVVEAVGSGMSESIELLASNEAHKYWLIYAYKTSQHHELRVCSVDVASLPPVSSVLHTAKLSTNLSHHTYTLKASPQNNRIAIANSDDETVDVFDFNNTNGTFGALHTTPSTHKIDGLAYGVEFSPDGKQLYAAGYTKAGGTPMLCQYEITGTGLKYVSSIQYWNYSGTYSPRGGGLKLGPDNNIYVVLAYDSNVGIVSHPNLVTSLSDRYSKMLLYYDPDSYDLQFSTGLTKPSVMECNSNSAPSVNNDTAILCLSDTSRTISVNVLKNDNDINDNKVFLTGAKFFDETDTAVARLTVNAVDSTVTLTVKAGVTFSDSYVFDIVYNVKDDGLPASQCAEGMLAIIADPIPVLSSERELSLCSGERFTYTATTAKPKTVISWSRAAVTGITSPPATGTNENIDEILTNNTVSDSITVTYLITLTSENCTYIDTVRVKVYAPLNGGSIGTSQTYCSGIQPLISLGTMSTPTGGSGICSYQWESSQDNEIFTAIGTATVQAYSVDGTAAQSTYYRRVASNVCGHVPSDTVQITIFSLPQVRMTIDTICIGLTAYLYPDVGGYWESDRPDIVDVVKYGTIVGKSAGDAKLTFTDTISGGSCSASIDITVNPYLNPDEITGDNIVCVGNTLVLSNTTSGGVWTKNNTNISFSNFTTNSVIVKGEAAGKSYVTYTVSKGICETKRTFQLKVISNNKSPRIIIGVER
ncbi:MAG: hypothetical protein LBG80_15525 [Bacteroidales bacterium]|jgi:hypothetical protein|nr:hypothetical protein [Bacteroidales bacterium]